MQTDIIIVKGTGLICHLDMCRSNQLFDSQSYTFITNFKVSIHPNNITGIKDNIRKEVMYDGKQKHN